MLKECSLFSLCFLSKPKDISKKYLKLSHVFLNNMSFSHYLLIKDLIKSTVPSIPFIDVLIEIS